MNAFAFRGGFIYVSTGLGPAADNIAIVLSPVAPLVVIKAGSVRGVASRGLCRGSGGACARWMNILLDALVAPRLGRPSLAPPTRLYRIRVWAIV